MQTGHAIITGGSSGIGLALARLLADRGWTLSLIARDRDKLQAAGKSLAENGHGSENPVHTFQADVADCQQVNQAIQEAIRDNGPPLLLVTSAGMVKPGYFTRLSAADFEQHIRVNYLGTVHAVQAVVPHMQKQKQGTIVMISSGAGLMGLFGYSAYAPSKFAVRGFAESLQAELRRDGIHVAVVYPPDTDTPQLHEEQKYRPVETQRIAASGGIMSAEDVADSIIAGMERGAFSITPGLSMTWLHRLHSLAGPLLRKYLDRLARTDGK